MASLSFILGIIGNVISILMFASPIKTFKHVVKKKSTENYKGLPYITTLLSTSLWTFYGLLKTDGLLVVTVNGAGAALHVIYVILFLIYAPKNVKVKSMKLVGAVNIAFLGAVIIVTLLALRGDTRVTLVGLLCAALTIGMYAAPLSAMRTVIKMKSVKYMPFFLSFFQFLNGAAWTGYAVLIKDYYIGVPNGIGFILGSAQLILYMIYRNKSTESDEKTKEEEEGSAHLVRGTIQMQDLNENDQETNMKNRSLNKGNSLPKPPLARQYSQNLTKTLSLSPHELENLNENDIEKGFKENH
ncbi:Multitransmembrane protein [Handroanthus impetiginosus]|uniref:Bidirectional sugar transporter SWEET n=1 Tax=Handroanthus impetiginosus TaxID=429701 RepID=A0A2G9GJA8_9LAMI|nr:Multitransmembrane protein [Handroanthus impetiginosus]